jgi:hypothetical protein
MYQVLLLFAEMMASAAAAASFSGCAKTSVL